LEKEKKRNKKGFLLQVIAIYLDSASLRSRLKAARNDVMRVSSLRACEAIQIKRVTQTFHW